MSNIRFRGGRVWYNPCNNIVKVYRNGKWHLVQHGVHYFYNGEWLPINCGFSSTYVANTQECEKSYNYTTTYITNTTQCEKVQA